MQAFHSPNHPMKPVVLVIEWHNSCSLMALGFFVGPTVYEFLWLVSSCSADDGLDDGNCGWNVECHTVLRTISNKHQDVPGKPCSIRCHINSGDNETQH